MFIPSFARGGIPALFVTLLVLGCGDETTAPPPPDTRVPDFSLPDVNPTSPTAGTDVSPRDFAGKVSAWYFGHAT